MPKLQIADIELFYDIQGTGEPLLLIGGFSCDSSLWLPVLPSLINQYQVIRLDNRGIGQSVAPDTPFSIQQMAVDALALLNFLKITKVHVAGSSMGGQIAQELALAAPEKIQSLMLLSSWAKGDAKFHAVIDMFGKLPDKVDARLYWQVVLPWIFAEQFYATPEAVEQVINSMLEYPYPPTPQVLYHQSRAILESDTSLRLANIRCPTLVMVGKQDILTPVNFSKQIAEGISNNDFVIIEDSGHGLIAEAPEAVPTAILNFLKKF